MRKEKIMKMTFLNSGIALVNVLLFSPGFVGLQIGGGSIFKAALGATMILMSVIIFVFGNYKLLIEKEKKMRANEIETVFDYIHALEQNNVKKTFVKDIQMIIEQIQRLEKKKEVTHELILQKFSQSEMSYSKFENVIVSAENLFYMNIKSILNKLNIFDQDEYDRVRKGAGEKNISQEFIEVKMSIYNQYITFIKDSIEDNEQILIKLDKLLLELSKFNSLEDGELESMSAMQEIDELINKAKFYK